MTDTPVPDVRELAAMALHGAEYRIVDDPDWDGLEEIDRESYREVADAVLAAVEPVIRRQVAEEIAADIERTTEAVMDREVELAFWQASGIARSHSTQPTQEETTNG